MSDDVIYNEEKEEKAPIQIEIEFKYIGEDGEQENKEEVDVKAETENEKQYIKNYKDVTEEQKEQNRKLLVKYYDVIKKQVLKYYYDDRTPKILRMRVSDSDFVQEAFKDILKYNSLVRYVERTDNKNFYAHLYAFIQKHIYFLRNHICNSYSDIKHGCLECLEDDSEVKNLDDKEINKLETAQEDKKALNDLKEWLEIDEYVSKLKGVYKDLFFLNPNNKRLVKLNEKIIFFMMYNELSYKEMISYIYNKDGKHIENTTLVSIINRLRKKVKNGQKNEKEK